MYGYSKKNSVTNKIIVMKTRYFLFVFLLCFFFSCAEEDNMVISNEMLTESSLQMEQAKIAIYAMGLDTTFISEWDRYYVVEEDILVCKDSVNLSRTLTRQYKRLTMWLIFRQSLLVLIILSLQILIGERLCKKSLYCTINIRD